MLEETKPLHVRLIEDADWLDGVAEGGDDARIVAVLREASRAVVRLELERDTAIRAGKALLVIQANKVRSRLSAVYAALNGAQDDDPSYREALKQTPGLCWGGEE